MQAWAGIICPLTTLEMFLREKAGEATYQGTFIAHWLHHLLFIDAPLWVFTVCYTAFALAVIAGWWFVRPDQAGQPGNMAAVSVAKDIPVAGGFMDREQHHREKRLGDGE